MTATTFLKGYLDFLRRDGWAVTLVCSGGPGVAELAVRSGIAFEPLAMEREPSPVKDMRALLVAIKILRKIRPDVLVYATPKASLIGSIAGKLVRVPRRVYELWGLRLETASGMARRVLWLLEALTMRLSTRVIANSRSMAVRAGELRLSGRREIETLGAGSSHGVDTDHFSKLADIPGLSPELRESLSTSDAPVVGFVGRMHPDKGIDILLDALRICADTGVKAQLLIVGADEGVDIEHDIWGMRGVVRVHTAGFTQDVRPMLRAMDVLALPSRREGFPNVVLEAAAMSVPAVVTDATGCVDAVVDTETGFIVPVGDAPALAAAIIEMLGDDKKRAAMAESARARAVELFEPSRIWALHSDAWLHTSNFTRTTAP
ncbi:glycosyltransferase family 4 protein [Microbacterium esteraromaticum]|uniref:glycosyltransferase family 4 protein n=1 Tax=Microbacterium esteraromaticum TaxID=57043 RepID=UPI001C9697F3|nr:glycosyltransferase family 4 protein [Microbacterium esteraromaticum]MBY6060310.1 glycosyltransferase family 4 protein [Microbacterium esteraromaticum]